MSNSQDPAEELPDSKELLDALLEHIPDIVFFKDRHGRFLLVNRTMLELFGKKTQEELQGKTDFDILLPQDALRTQRDEQHVMETGEPILGRVTKKHHPDGSPWWSITSKLPLENARGQIIGTCGISRDITPLMEAEKALQRSNAELQQTLEELKAAQVQLIEAEKAASVARLAAGVAHEVRNPLNILSMGFEFLSADDAVASDPDKAAVLREMREALTRSDQVITTLLESARPKGLALKEEDLNALIEQSIGTIQNKIGKAGIRLVKDLKSDLPRIKADSDKLLQVLEGILMNAVEVMPDGGELGIRTRQFVLDAENVCRDAGARCGQLFNAGDTIVELDVEDTGGGIPEKLISQIFDPFFTTKETNKKGGLGLGLTMCRSIIELHRGTLHVENRSDQKGAKVMLKFKAAQ